MTELANALSEKKALVDEVDKLSKKLVDMEAEGNDVRGYVVYYHHAGIFHLSCAWIQRVDKLNSEVAAKTFQLQQSLQAKVNSSSSDRNCVCM